MTDTITITEIDFLIIVFVSTIATIVGRFLSNMISKFVKHRGKKD